MVTATDAVDPPEIGSTPRKRRTIPDIAPLAVVLVALIVYFSVAAEFFFSTENFINILQNTAVIGIIACPATLLMVGGQLDLSVGSVAGFVGMTAAVLAAPSTDAPLAAGLPVLAAVLGAVVAALLVGVMNAVCVTRIGINPLITTLGTLAIFRGLTKVLGDGQSIRIERFGTLGVQRVFGLPLPVYIFMAVTVTFFLLLRITVFGRSMYAIGSNPAAARLAGIRTHRTIFTAYLLSAFCVAIAGLIRLSQVGSASINSGSGFELSVVTAVVLGGASLAGGRGGIAGTIVAVLVVGVLGNGLVQLSVPSYWIEVANGALLLGAVAFDQLRSRWFEDSGE